MTEATLAATTAPAASPLRPWYLVAATAAFAVMFVAILGPSGWFLNWVHVMSGTLWTGIDLVVRSQKFRIAAMIMKRTSVPLATEYATRLVHLVQGIRLEDLVGFFDFEPAESRVLLQDVLGTGLVVERNGQLFLSAQGHEALSPMTDRLDLFEVEEIATTIALDLAAFTPVEEATLNPRETRLVQELKLPDREKAATAIASARDAFDLHFQDWPTSPTSFLRILVGGERWSGRRRRRQPRGRRAQHPDRRIRSNSTSCSLSRFFGWCARGLYPLARGCRRIWRGEVARPARAAWAVQRLLAARW